MCQQIMDKESGWHIHHVIPRVKGGPYTLNNLILLHPVCHRQLHNQDLCATPASTKRL
ncbi:HNH endonuclease signature motif containing protein [Candidatus Williamhamiltonella defendens]|uniref:HNH endonuclease signature motif containing protein n=1 Tax=Candidatus Williamhamiltonella defendens TaxID=138072 RepID=UPI00387EA0D1